jgi:hypothetical protein
MTLGGSRPLQKVEISQAYSALAVASLRRRPPSMRVTVGGLTPVARAISACVAVGLARRAAMITALCSAGSRLCP